METKRIKVVDGEMLAKRILYLAWEASGSPSGLGWLRDKPEATEDEIFENVCNSGDYPGTSKSAKTKNGITQLDADYVFGRMIKLRLYYSKDFVEFRNFDAEPDYNSWYYSYKTVDELALAAIESLK